MATKIITKNSSTATSIPTAGDLVQGELAVNVTDKRLFTEDSGGAIVELGTNPSTIDVAGAATFSGNVDVFSTGSAALSITSSSGSQLLFANTSANTASRDWAIKSNSAAFGDLLIQQETGFESGTYANKLAFSATGAATFSGAVNVTDATYSIYSSGAAATIGYVGNSANDLTIFSSTVGHNGLRFHVNGILPTDNTGAIVDADADLGIGSHRFKDLYLSGTVNAGAATFSGITNVGALRVATGNTDYNLIVRTGGPNYIQQGDATNDIVQFRSGSTTAGSGTQRVTINASGNLLVGTSNASPTSGSGVKLVDDGTNGRVYVQGANQTSGEGYSLHANGSYRFYVQYSGQINSTSSSIAGISDVSLKENIRDLDKGLETILSLQPRRFDWKSGDGNDIMGFVAQEVETVLPELVHAYKYNSEETKLCLKMGDMMPSVVKAIQEQQAIIEALTARLEALEGA